MKTRWIILVLAFGLLAVGSVSLASAGSLFASRHLPASPPLLPPSTEGKGEDQGKNPPGEAIGATTTELSALDQIGGQTQAIDVEGNYAYVDLGARFSVIDISVPSNLKLMGQSEIIPELINDIWVEGDLAYVAAGTAGLGILDVSDPASPKIMSMLPTDRNSLTVMVAGNYAYVANRDGGLRIIDVSNPTRPVEVGVYLNGDAWAHDVWVSATHAFVAQGTGGLDVVDISDPANPTFVVTVNVGNALGLTQDGDYLYVAAGSDLEIVEVSQPAQPNKVSSLTFPKGNAVGVDVDGSYAYVAATDGGLRIVNVSDPNSPFEEGSYPWLNGVWNVSAVGQTVYLAAGWDNMLVMDTTDPTSPRRIGRYDTFGGAQGITIVGDYAYLGTGQDGLWIVDVSNPARMEVIGFSATSGNTRGIDVQGNYAYLAAGQGGLYIFDVSDVSKPTITSWFTETLEYARSLDVVSNTLYLTDKEDVITIDVTDPAQPRGIETTHLAGSANAVQVVGDYVFVAAGGAGLYVLNPADLSVVSQLAMVSNSWDLQVDGNYAYVAAGLDGLWIVDVSDPANPQHITTYPVPGNSIGIYEANATVYLADGLGEVRIVDVQDPYNPIEIAAYDSPGYAEDAFFSNEAVFMADGAGGLFAFSARQTTTPLAPNVSLARIGTSFLGEADNDQAGSHVTGLGDINNDGLDDFAIGAVGGNQVYLFFGKTGGWPSLPLNLASADAWLSGEYAGDSLGSSIAALGDVTGDGIDDFAIGASNNSETFSKAGQVYLIPGNPDPTTWKRELLVTDLAIASFLGEAGDDYAGTAVSGTGDVNNDGLNDLLIGAPGNGEIEEDAGQTYLLFGRTSGWSMDMLLGSQADASFLGLSGHAASGETLANVGNVNGDEYDDLLIGAWLDKTHEANAGAVYLVFGKATDAWEVDTPLAAADASYEGESLGDWAGYSVAGVGDVNGDGYDDFAFGAPGDDIRGRQTGSTYLVLGKPTGWRLHKSVTDAEASFIGETTEDWSGISVAAAGDVNGDSFDDFLIGATGNTYGGRDAGQSYLILGRSSGAWSYGMELSAADASFWGETTNDESGGSLAGVGDVNGDGLGDFLIGAPGHSATGVNAGKAYLLFGNTGPTAGLFAPDLPFTGINIYHKLTTSYYDLADGYRDLDDVRVNLSGGGKEITLRYQANKDNLYLLPESGQIGPCTPGQALTLTYGAFELDCETTTARNDGYRQLTLEWQLKILEEEAWPYTLYATLLAWDETLGEARPYKAGYWQIDANPAVSDLSTAFASFWGEAANDQAGWSVSPAGDVNADDLTDFLVGAPNNDQVGSNAGQVYLFLGKEEGWGSDLSLSDADASFVGEAVDNYAGFAVAGVGDVNGDGYDDILIGAYRNETSGVTAGKVYVVMGRPTWLWSMQMSLADAEASYLAETGSDYAGYTVAAAGDVNHDSFKDMLVGAWGRENAINENQAGMAYLILGKPTDWFTNTSLTNVDASFVGEDFDDWASFSLAGVGDVDKDGFDDFLIGAPNDEADIGASAGQVYLILGKDTGWAMYTVLNQADASFVGEASGDMAGIDVSGAGDVNGDGYNDFLIGAWLANAGVGPETGETYLMLGKASGWAMGTSLAQADGFFVGERPYDRAGRGVTGVGDINDDGYSDIAIGAYGSNDGGSDAGKVYIAYGQETFAEVYHLAAANSMFWGEQPYDNAGFALAGISGMTGRGTFGLLVSAPDNDENGGLHSAGQVYLLLLAEISHAPEVYSVIPYAISNEVDRQVALNGLNFQPIPTVTVGTTPVSVTFGSEQALTITIPAGFPAGAYDITVTNPDALYVVVPDALTVITPKPTLSAVIPSAISNVTPQTVTLNGQYFVATPTVKVGGFSVSATYVSSSQLTITVPAGFTPGVYDVVIKNPDGQQDKMFGGLTVAVVLSPPDLQFIVPSPITTEVTRTVTLSGANFVNHPTVKVGEIEVAVTFVNSSTLTITIPAGFPRGVYDIVVVNPDGQQDTLARGLAVMGVDELPQAYLPVMMKTPP